MKKNSDPCRTDSEKYMRDMMAKGHLGFWSNKGKRLVRSRKFTQGDCAVEGATADQTAKHPSG